MDRVRHFGLEGVAIAAEHRAGPQFRDIAGVEGAVFAQITGADPADMQADGVNLFQKTSHLIDARPVLTLGPQILQHHGDRWILRSAPEVEECRCPCGDRRLFRRRRRQRLDGTTIFASGL